MGSRNERAVRASLLLAAERACGQGHRDDLIRPERSVVPTFSAWTSRQPTNCSRVRTARPPPTRSPRQLTRSRGRERLGAPAMPHLSGLPGLRPEPRSSGLWGITQKWRALALRPAGNRRIRLPLPTRDLRGIALARPLPSHIAPRCQPRRGSPCSPVTCERRSFAGHALARFGMLDDRADRRTSSLRAELRAPRDERREVAPEAP